MDSDGTSSVAMRLCGGVVIKSSGGSGTASVVMRSTGMDINDSKLEGLLFDFASDHKVSNERDKS